MYRSSMGLAIPAAFAVAIGMLAAQLEGPASAGAKEPGQTSGADVRAGDGLLGEWWTEGREGRVRFERQPDGTYRGITTWRAPKPPSADNPDTDIHNPDPRKRARSTIGIVLIWNLTHEDARYRGGYVYNPRDGGTYRFEAELVDHDTLKIRGYVGIRLFGQNQIWKRLGAQPLSR